MCTCLFYHHLFILLIPWITTGLNTYISDNDTYWQSTSPFIPTESSSSGYGRIRLRQHMTMSLTIQWHGRVSSNPSTYEQIVRIGWPATSGGCTAQNSRYPSLWIDNKENCFHLSISEINSCGQGWRISSYTIQKYETYQIYIEFNDTFVYMTINNTIVLNQLRTSPTQPSYINELMNIYVPSDYWNVPYIIANVSLWNISIQSFNPYITQVPTDYPTTNPTTNPTINPAINPTISPTTRPILSIKTTSPTLSPTIRPTINHKPTMNDIQLSTSNIILLYHTDNDPRMDTSHLLYLLIAGITSCIVGTCLILVTIKKCGDFKKNSKKLSVERLSFQMKKVNEKTIENDNDDCVEVEFEIDGYINNKFSIPLKPGKPNRSPIPSYVDNDVNDNGINNAIDIDIEPGNDALNNSVNNASDSEESNITNITNNEVEEVEHVLNRLSHLNHLNIYTINEGDGVSNATEIIGIDGMNEDDTMLTKSETMSPSKLNMPIRKYLMSESIEEEYIKQLMDQAVIKKKRLSSLLIISDNEALDGSNDDSKKVEILDDDYDVYDDDETLPILPGTNTDGGGESLAEYNLKIPYDIINGIINEGYEWITMALLQIDSEDWKIYLNNFKRNKVNEKRLCDLKKCDMRELIPNIGPRNEFEKLLRLKLGKTLSEIYDNSEY